LEAQEIINEAESRLPLSPQEQRVGEIRKARVFLVIWGLSPLMFVCSSFFEGKPLDSSALWVVIMPFLWFILAVANMYVVQSAEDGKVGTLDFSKPAKGDWLFILPLSAHVASCGLGWLSHQLVGFGFMKSFLVIGLIVYGLAYRFMPKLVPLVKGRSGDDAAKQ
jgi:hypothetical protein